MGKGKSQPVIWLLLYRKLTPVEIIRLGYKKTTVYSYFSQFKEVMKEFEEKLKLHKKGEDKAKK